MTGNCKGCASDKLQARNLCGRCYDFARFSAKRQGLALGEYLATTENLASPGRHHDRPYQHNHSGHRGCSFDRGKWRACIKHQGKTVHLGRYTDLAQARAAYETAQARVRNGLPPATPHTRQRGADGAEASLDEPGVLSQQAQEHDP